MSKKGGAFYNLMIKPQSFSGPVSWDCDFNSISMILYLFLSPILFSGCRILNEFSQLT